MSFSAWVVGSGGAGELRGEVMGIKGDGRVSEVLEFSERIPDFLQQFRMVLDSMPNPQVTSL